MDQLMDIFEHIFSQHARENLATVVKRMVEEVVDAVSNNINEVTYFFELVDCYSYSNNLN
jgi:hypothetical protein